MDSNFSSTLEASSSLSSLKSDGAASSDDTLRDGAEPVDKRHFAKSIGSSVRKKLATTLTRKESSASISASDGQALQVRSDDPFNEVGRGIKQLYKKVVEPLEKKTNFHRFVNQKYDDAEFEAKPIVLVVGQYSTGKSSFIRYLIGEDYPDINIGSEPTTDKFIAVIKGPERKVIQGHALISLKNLPFRNLNKFGNTFLSRLQCSMSTESSLLEGVCFVDSPGVLAGHKQFDDRGYDYQGVLAWFAERADRILVMFDANKMDISDEMNEVLTVIRPHNEKVRMIFNKADLVAPKDLLRSYGSLMWGLGKNIRSPEASKIYIGSFWEEEYLNDEWREVFEEDRQQLVDDIKQLPMVGATRKVGDFTKRLRTLKVYALVVNELLGRLPMFFAEKKKAELVQKLPDIYSMLAAKHDLAPSDFPSLKELQAKLTLLPWDKFKRISRRDIDRIERIFEEDLPRVVALIPNVGQMRHGNSMLPKKPVVSKRWMRLSTQTSANEGKDPRMTSAAVKKAASQNGHEPKDPTRDWIVKTSNPSKCSEGESNVQSQGPAKGTANGNTVQKVLEEMCLSNEQLMKIRSLLDVETMESEIPDQPPADLTAPPTDEQG